MKEFGIGRKVKVTGKYLKVNKKKPFAFKIKTPEEYEEERLQGVARWVIKVDAVDPYTYELLENYWRAGTVKSWLLENMAWEEIRYYVYVECSYETAKNINNFVQGKLEECKDER